MTRFPALLLAGMLSTSALSAQAMIRPKAPPLDSAQIVLRAAALVMRDSLLSVSVATARLQRDYANASTAMLEGRARSIQQACSAAGRTLPRTRGTVVGATAKAGQQQMVKTSLLKAIDHLQAELARCETQFKAMGLPGKGEEVRGYGNRRTEPINDAARDYERSMNTFLGTKRILLPLIGAPKSEFAG